MSVSEYINTVVLRHSDDADRHVCLVGRPIYVEKCEKPTSEQVMHAQKLYIEELYRWAHFAAGTWKTILSVFRIWETYKDVFAAHRKKELAIVD